MLPFRRRNEAGFRRVRVRQLYRGKRRLDSPIEAQHIAVNIEAGSAVKADSGTVGGAYSWRNNLCDGSTVYPVTQNAAHRNKKVTGENAPHPIIAIESRGSADSLHARLFTTTEEALVAADQCMNACSHGMSG
jgi:hypothetical protein